VPLDLRELLDPSHTAVITMEMQRGVCGDLANIEVLSKAVAEAGAATTVGTLLAAARAAGATVVHCTYELRADRRGTRLNSPMMRALARNPSHLLVGSPATELLSELGPQPGDLSSVRRHGFSPFIGTDLDAQLRNEGVTTVVVTGVSLNLGVPGTVIEAVNSGYDVVVPRQAVVGTDPDYAEAVLRNTIALIANVVDVDDVVTAWS
jgi:nicotinamidase-related amidase